MGNNQGAPVPGTKGETEMFLFFLCPPQSLFVMPLSPVGRLQPKSRWVSSNK